MLLSFLLLFFFFVVFVFVFCFLVCLIFVVVGQFNTIIMTKEKLITCLETIFLWRRSQYMLHAFMFKSKSCNVKLNCAA